MHTPPPHSHIVVVSDLHLGLPEHAARSDAFARWLDRFGDERRPDGRPWRLILAGDIFEFLHLAPPGGEPEFELPPDLRIAVAKYRALRPVLRPALDALGRFAAKGHDLHFVMGNHDRELILRPIRRMLIRDIVRGAGVSPKSAAGKRLARRVVLHPWFYSEKERIHVEHGHQFDEFSSYTDVLLAHPTHDAGHLQEPVSHQAVRHFIYPTDGLLTPEEGEQWGFFDFMKLAWRVGLRRGLGFGGRYLRMLGLLVVEAIRSARHPVEPTGRALRLVHGHAKRYGLELANVLEIRRFWHRPANPWAVMQCFFGDRFLLMAAALVAIIAFLGGFGVGIETAVAVPSVSALVVGAWIVLDRKRSVEQHPRLVRASRALRDSLGVPYVIFGHSHVPARLRISGGKGWYLNPGGWADHAEQEPGTIVLLRNHDGSLAMPPVLTEGDPPLA